MLNGRLPVFTLLALLILNASATADEESSAPTDSAQPASDESATDTSAEGSAPQATASDSDKPFLVRPYTGMTSLGITFKSDSGKSVEFSPNSPMFIGLKLGYKGYALSGSAATSPADQATYGKSKIFDLQLGKAFQVMQRELLVELFLQNYQGYYIENTRSVDPTATGKIIRSDLSGTTFGFSAIYYLSETFSHDATFGEMKPSSESHGSWLIRASLGVQGMSSDSDTAFFPATVRASFGDAATMHAFNSGFISLSGGYAYDWRFWDQLYLAGAIAGGLSAATSTYRLSGTSNLHEASVGVTSTAFLALGYGGETFHGGLCASGNLESMKAKTLDVQFYRGQVLLMAGARF